MRTFVFAGPSIFGLDRANYRDLQFLPPASCGDIYRLMERKPEIICLIDGTFEHHPAVWHKEILFALANGVRVVGASSMGALRAAECFRFGMMGLGRIFRQYQTGQRTSDADVAVLHGPAETGFLPLTVSLADVEFSAIVLRRKRIISATAAGRLVMLARSMHYKDRSWEEIISRLGLSAEDDARLRHICRSPCLSLKRRDAEHALRKVAAGDIQPPHGQISLDQFQLSQFFHRLTRERA